MDRRRKAIRRLMDNGCLTGDISEEVNNTIFGVPEIFIDSHRVAT